MTTFSCVFDSLGSLDFFKVFSWLTDLLRSLLLDDVVLRDNIVHVIFNPSEFRNSVAESFGTFLSIICELLTCQY